LGPGFFTACSSETGNLKNEIALVLPLPKLI